MASFGSLIPLDEEPEPLDRGPQPPGAQGPPSQPQPPADENDLAQRVSGWSTFLEKLATDDNLRNGFLNFGTQLMQPRTQGQTQAGAFGKAVQSGQETYQKGKQRDFQNQAATAQLKDQSRRTDAYVDVTGAQAGATRSATERGNARFPKELEHLDQQIQQLKTTNDPEMQELIKDRVFGEIERSGWLNKLTQAQIESLPLQLQVDLYRAQAAGQPASAVQQVEQLAQRLERLRGLNPDEAYVTAQNQFLFSNMETPGEFWIKLKDAMETDLLLTPDPAEKQRKSAEYIEEFKTYRDNYNRMNMSALSIGGQATPPPTAQATPEQQARIDSLVKSAETAKGQALTAEEKQKITTRVVSGG